MVTQIKKTQRESEAADVWAIKAASTFLVPAREKRTLVQLYYVQVYFLQMFCVSDSSYSSLQCCGRTSSWYIKGIWNRKVLPLLVCLIFGLSMAVIAGPRGFLSACSFTSKHLTPVSPCASLLLFPSLTFCSAARGLGEWKEKGVVV